MVLGILFANSGIKILDLRQTFVFSSRRNERKKVTAVITLVLRHK